MNLELSCFYKLDICGNEFNIPEKIIKLLWFLDGPHNNYNVPEHIKSKFNYLFNTKQFTEYVEPSLISVMCRIEKPFENILQLNKSYKTYDTYLEMDRFTRYIYWQWLSDISKPSNNTMILFYALERHIFHHTNQYDNAIDVAVKILDSTNDKSTFSYQIYSLLYLLDGDEDKKDLRMEILNKFENSTYFSFSNWYLDYRIKHKKECQFDDFIRICFSKIYASNAGLISAKLRKKVLKYENVLQKAWDTYIANNGVVKLEYVVDKTKETRINKYYIPLNNSIKKKKIEIPPITDYIKSWAEKIVEDVLNIASNIRPEDINRNETDIVLNISGGFNKKYNNDILFSDLFPKIDGSCFDKCKEAYKNKQCPICGSFITLPLNNCKCSSCGTKLWVKTEILTNQKVLLDNKKFNYLKYLKNELFRRNKVLQGIIQYAKLNINEVECIYKMYEGAKSIEDVCIYMLEEYIQEAIESEKYDLLCKTLECLSLFQYKCINDMKGAFENRIKLALTIYCINNSEIHIDYLNYDSKLQIYKFEEHIIFIAYIITSGFNTENVKNKKDSINWEEINFSIDSIIEKNPIYIKRSNFKDCSNIIKNMVREQVEKRVQSLLKNSKNRIIVSDDSE